MLRSTSARTAAITVACLTALAFAVPAAAQQGSPRPTSQRVTQRQIAFLQRSPSGGVDPIGPTSVCARDDYMASTAFSSNYDVVASFPLNSHYMVAGQFNENDDVTYPPTYDIYPVSFMNQTAATNYNEVIIGVRNDSSLNVTLAGWLINEYIPLGGSC